MKKLITLFLILVFVTSCGRGPRNLPVFLPADAGLSCQQLAGEMDNTKAEIAKMKDELAEIGGKNAGLYVASWFTLLATLPFVDVQYGQYDDLKVLRQRYHHLAGVASSKSCTFPIQNLEEFEKNYDDEINDEIRGTYPNKK